MKQKDVKIRGHYMTEVSGSKVEVIVTGEAQTPTLGRVGRFPCKRADNGRELPKGRTAASLHPVPPSAEPADPAGVSSPHV